MRRAWAKITGRKIVGEITFSINYEGKTKTKRAAVYEGESVHDVMKRVLGVKTREHELGVIYDQVGPLSSQFIHFNQIDALTGQRSVAAVQNGGEILYLNPDNMAVNHGRRMMIEITESFEHVDLPNGSTSRINGVFSEFLSYPIEMQASAIGLAAAFETMQAYRALPPHVLQPFWLAHSQKGESTRENVRRMVSEAVIKKMLGCGINLAVSSEFVREKAGATGRGSIGVSVQFAMEEQPVFHAAHAAFSNALPIVEAQPQQAGAREGFKELQNSGSSKAGKPPIFGWQDDEVQGGKQKEKNGNFKPVPLSSLTNFKAAIFDLDGVVVDSESAHLRSFNKLLAPFGVKITEKMWRENYTGVGSLAILEDVFARNGIKEGVGPWMAARAEIYHDVIEREGLKEIAGFSQFFGVLERNGIKVAVASGGHKPHILASMMSIGMPRVEFVGLEDVKNAKPAPDTFLLAAAKLGVEPSQCVVFEDSLAGIRAAAAAGMPCIALSTTLPAGKIKGKAALIVNNFASPVLRREISRLISKKGGSKKEKAPSWLYPTKRRKTAAGKSRRAKKSIVAAFGKKAKAGKSKMTGKRTGGKAASTRRRAAGKKGAKSRRS